MHYSEFDTNSSLTELLRVGQKKEKKKSNESPCAEIKPAALNFYSSRSDCESHLM